MYVYNIKTAEEVEKLGGADIQDLLTAIAHDPNYFNDNIQDMAIKKYKLMCKYGSFADLHLNELTAQ